MTETMKLPGLFDNWILGLDKVDRDKLFELTPRLIQYSEDMVGLRPSDEVSVTSLLNELVSGEKEWSGPLFRDIPTKDQCLWVLDYTTETLLRWEREQRGRFAAVDPNYMSALAKLESD